jgi:hypothetical protein
VNTFVIDASIAVKWVVEEDRTAEALALRQRSKLIAPQLLVAECANILWKKVQREELLKEEALLAARRCRPSAGSVIKQSKRSAVLLNLLPMIRAHSDRGERPHRSCLRRNNCDNIVKAMGIRCRDPG